MTIMEAIKSERPFKRSEDVYWKFVAPDRSIRIDFGHKSTIAFDADDILADDWEIKQ